MHTLETEPENAVVSHGPIVLEFRPEHARWLGCVVAAAAHLDHELGFSFALLLKKPSRIGMDIYEAMESDRGKRELLVRATNATLKGTEHRIFTALLTFAFAQMKRRNTVAHDLWDHSYNIPNHSDKALLVSVKHDWNVGKDRAAYFEKLDRARSSKNPVFRNPPPVLARKHVHVYSADDLKRMYNDVVHANRLIGHFWQMKNAPRNQQHIMRKKLLAEPPLQTTLDGLRASSRSKPIDALLSSQSAQVLSKRR